MSSGWPPAVMIFSPLPSCCSALLTLQPSCCPTDAPHKTGLREKDRRREHKKVRDYKTDTLLRQEKTRCMVLKSKQFSCVYKTTKSSCTNITKCVSVVLELHAWIYIHTGTSHLNEAHPYFSLWSIYGILPWFRYVSVSSCSLTAGDVAAHSTYWNGGFLVSFSGGMLVFSCLKIGRASTSLRDQRKRKEAQKTPQGGCDDENTMEKSHL